MNPFVLVIIVFVVIGTSAYVHDITKPDIITLNHLSYEFKGTTVWLTTSHESTCDVGSMLPMTTKVITDQAVYKLINDRNRGNLSSTMDDFDVFEDELMERLNANYAEKLECITVTNIQLHDIRHD